MEKYLDRNIKQYLLFLANNEIFAIESSIVVEIVEFQQITKVPKMQKYIKGVTNVRGNIIAVIDLLQRLGFSESKIGDKTSLIILNVEYNEVNFNVALMVDEVYEVDYINDIDIKDTPSFGTKINKQYIKNMARYNSEYIPILNINEILKLEEISVLKK